MEAAVGEIIGMGRSELLVAWAEIIPDGPPKHLSTPFMRRILAFEIQARRQGGLSSAATTKLKGIESGKTRVKSPRLKPGARLLREWNGVSHVVDVTDEGYLWHGQQYRSLSAVARTITGAHWSGPRFFGLTGRSGE